MSLYSDYLLKFPKIKEILKKAKENNRVEISEVNRDSASLISLCLNYELDDNTIFIITPNIFQAQKIYDSLSLVTENAYFYPKDDFVSVELLTESFDFKLQRVNTLCALFDDPNKKMVVAPLSALLSKVPHKEVYQEHIIKLKKNDQFKPKTILDKLIEAGYERNYTIEKQGDISLRGSILDIFPINDIKAYRIDFFGDEIDSIKVLDTESQRSKGEIDSITVMPKNEILFTEDEKDAIRFFIKDKLSQNLSQKTKDKFEHDLEYLEEFAENTVLQKYMSLFITENYSFVDYVDNKTVVFFDYEDIIKQEAVTNNQIYDYLSDYKDYFNSINFLNVLETYSFNKTIYLTRKRKYYDLDEIYFNSKEITNYENRLDLFIAELKTRNKKKTILINLNELSYDTLISAFDSNGIDYVEVSDKIISGKINLIKDLPFLNFDIDDINTLSISTETIFKVGSSKKGRYNLQLETKRLKSINELKIGDYVVHYDYGIGKFLEITTMTLGRNTSDFIHIKYDKDQSVYIPVENLHVLSKYAGSENANPKLSSLNTKEWQKTRNNARKKAGELAERLLNLYSEREKAEGFKYYSDDDTQREFEADFDHELTKDQAQAIVDVKADMESGKPMDRLVCGDVGFGKTEVALRAAFKAVLSGKQVAYLAPTTILARQHYYTFKERMDKYGVNVALVSRFVSNNKIKENLINLKRGTLDIIIGTHRLLSKDVEFKNLGLFIIDEEQRFGVEAKEKIKEMKLNIDCLTLTATPIPRTLQMAITGIKNISLIETAPKGRYPIQTYVLERNDYVVKDAIERELSKGGQVFYLYNRVEDMERIVEYVHNLVPEARLSVIHGKMNKDDTENTIESFINQESDILITTTIIETGVDIPNANTLIVHDSERYGLAQLYQIKGRVGRSDKISYAYLMYEKNARLTDDAMKRLKAIKDFAELGSGFKIAVRDLTNRGAGEILGKEQSGFMDKIGVDLYLKILDEEIKAKKGEEKQEETEDIKVLMSRHIDKDYISDEYVLIEIHTKISKIQSTEDLLNLKAELEDRFGKVRENLLEYMYSKLTENLINSMHFERVDISDYQILFVIDPEKTKTVDSQSLFRYAMDISKNFTFFYKVNRIQFLYRENESRINMHQNISKYLEILKKEYLI